jgi:hypothetical protein
MSKISGDFTKTVKFGDDTVDVFIEWSADTGYLDDLVAVVSLAHVRLDEFGRLAKIDLGTLKVDYVDIFELLSADEKSSIDEACMQDAHEQMTDGGDEAYDRMIDEKLFRGST